MEQETEKLGTENPKATPPDTEISGQLTDEQATTIEPVTYGPSVELFMLRTMLCTPTIAKQDTVVGILFVVYHTMVNHGVTQVEHPIC